VRIAISKERRLYVIPFKNGRRKGYTCLGFNYAFDKASAVARWLKERGVEVKFPEWRSVGRVGGYREFEVVIKAAREHFNKTKEKCPIELCQQLVGLEGKRVEIVDLFGDKRRFYVGKSTGSIPCHIELAKINSSGGFPVTGVPFRSLAVIGRGRSKQ